MDFLNVTGNFKNHYVEGQTLGRYEYSRGEGRPPKFYHVIECQDGTIKAFYGCVGSAPQGQVPFPTRKDAAERIKSKFKNGYTHIPGYVGTELQWVQEQEERLKKAWQDAPVKPSMGKPRF